ncbi:polar amino acid transport system substrate-binding protein [uncultured Gammaproteobacteria bacterium]
MAKLCAPRRLSAAILVALLVVVGLARTGPAVAQTQTVTKIELTAEERTFLADKPLRLGVDPSWPPFEFFDEADGRYSGIAAGFVEAVSARLGVAMVVQTGLSWTAALEHARAGTLDILPAVTPTPERRKFLRFTRPYASFPAVIATRKDQFVSGLEDLHRQRVGVSKGYAVEEILRRDHPELVLVNFDTVEVGLRELDAGGITAFVDNLGSLTYAIDKLKASRLKIAAPTPYTFDLVMGVRKDWPLVLSALDKALASLTDAERAEIKSRWLARVYQDPVKIDWMTVGPVGGVLVLVLIGLVAWNRRLGRAVRERKRAEQRLQERAEDFEARSVAKTRLAEISARLQQATTLEDLATALLSGLAPLVGATHGVFYRLENEGEPLRLLGGYGQIESTRIRGQFALGECLIGECAQSQRPLYLNHLPQGDVLIRSGLGQSSPRTIAVLPLTLNRRLLGVIELASLTAFASHQRELFDEFLPVVAMNVEILARTLRTQSLLNESREAGQRLAAQTGELQVQQDRLQETETWFRSIIESAPDGMLVVDEWGSIILANAMLGRMFGYAPENLIGKGMEILVPKARRENHRLLRDRFFHGLDSELNVGRGRALTGMRKDGSEFPIEVSLAKLPALGARGLSVCASVRDITDRQQAQTAIAETEALRTASEAALRVAEASEQARAVAEQARESLSVKNEEIERFNRLAMGREEKIVELKTLVNRLAGELGQPVPFQATAEIDRGAGEAANLAPGGEAANLVSSGEAANLVSSGDCGQLIKAQFIEVVRAEQIQALFENFCDAIGIAAAVIDLEGQVLVKARWQRACTDFHRINADTCRHCADSNTDLASKLQQGQEFAMYSCENGLTECASPIIVNGIHVANAFLGQFLLNPPDLDFLARQADLFGFDRDDYLKAVREVPVVGGVKLISIIGFLTDFAKIVALLSLAKIEAEQAQGRLRLERGAAISLAEDADAARRELAGSQRHLEQLIETGTGEIRAREEELCRERDELQRMLDSSPIAVGISVAGRLRFANACYLNWTGLKPGDAVAGAYADDGVREQVLAGLQSAGIVRDLPLRLRAADGQSMDMLATFMRTQYEGEAGILGWLVNIGALKPHKQPGGAEPMIQVSLAPPRPGRENTQAD